MFNGSNCDRKSQLSGILTEPLNPRGWCRPVMLQPINSNNCNCVSLKYHSFTLSGIRKFEFVAKIQFLFIKKIKTIYYNFMGKRNSFNLFQRLQNPERTC